MISNSTIIALAWPDTKVVKEGKWYDMPMKWFGILKNGYYKAGHAAFLLIDHQNGEVHYFDFGRYHTPYQYGRVRDKQTDPDINVKIRAQIVNGEITNLKEILFERYNNKACHGEGKLTAAVVKNICFNSAYQKVKELQAKEAIPYGPFTFNGSTCSRLVVQVVYEATKNKMTKFFIRLPYTISATPRSNKKVLNEHSHYYEVVNGRIETYKNSLFWLRQLTSKNQKRDNNFQPLFPKTA